MLTPEYPVKSRIFDGSTILNRFWKKWRLFLFDLITMQKRNTFLTSNWFPLIMHFLLSFFTIHINAYWTWKILDWRNFNTHSCKSQSTTSSSELIHSHWPPNSTSNTTQSFLSRFLWCETLRASPKFAHSSILPCTVAYLASKAWQQEEIPSQNRTQHHKFSLQDAQKKTRKNHCLVPQFSHSHHPHWQSLFTSPIFWEKGRLPTNQCIFPHLNSFFEFIFRKKRTNIWHRIQSLLAPFPLLQISWILMERIHEICWLLLSCTILPASFHTQFLSCIHPICQSSRWSP